MIKWWQTHGINFCVTRHGQCFILAFHHLNKVLLAISVRYIFAPHFFWISTSLVFCNILYQIWRNLEFFCLSFEIFLWVISLLSLIFWWCSEDIEIRHKLELIFFQFNIFIGLNYVPQNCTWTHVGSLFSSTFYIPVSISEAFCS